MNDSTSFLKSLVAKYNSTSLIVRIVIGLIIGLILGLLVPGAQWIAVAGDLFVGALKAIAPVLVFVLVSSALVQGQEKLDSRFGLVLILYMVSTFLAAVVAVIGSFMFPQTLVLNVAATEQAAPSGIGEVLRGLLLNMVANPLGSIVEGKYIGILFWAVAFGLVMNNIASESTKRFMAEVAEGTSALVRHIINLAPFGICGLVFANVSGNGLSIFTDYGKLLVLLVGCMLAVALIVDPLIAFVVLRRNPYPLVLRCLRESGITAFFTRSSAANIPVNMELCKELGLDEDMYSVSIPLGSTINMDGAAAVITTFAMTAAFTAGAKITLPMAILLSVVATFSACGTSGVAGGSLLLVPLGCSLFGISNDVAMQVVGVGFIVSVIQDSMETALNSSGDVIFTATAEFLEWKKEGKELPI